MTGAGRGWLAAAIAAIAVVGASAAVRIGPAAPASAVPGMAVSSTWLCPHGGGPSWTVTIAIANPGTEAIQARLTSYGERQPKEIAELDVPAHGEVLQEVPGSVRAASTRVDVFGGWAAVGWTEWAGRTGSGLGAEPCTSTPGPSWSVVDGVTNRRTESYLVIMDPFTADAVVDVALFLSERPPVRSAEWSDLPVDAGTSIALDLGNKTSGALGERIVGAQITASVGRVAASSLAVEQGGGIRSVLASPVLSNRWIIPAAGGSGSGTLSLLVPQETPVRYDVTQLSAEAESQTAATPTEARQGGTSASSAQIGSLGPSAVIVDVREGGPVVAALREGGSRDDEAVTGGVPAAATAWVVLPTAFGLDPRPSLALVNDGDQPVSATLTLLHEGGGSLGDTMQVTVPPGTLGVPGKFLRQDHVAAVLVSADGPIVALGAGTAGSRDSARYAMSVGVPIPAGVLSAVP